MKKLFMCLLLISTITFGAMDIHVYKQSLTECSAIMMYRGHNRDYINQYFYGIIKYMDQLYKLDNLVFTHPQLTEDKKVLKRIICKKLTKHCTTIAIKYKWCDSLESI